VDLLEVFHGNLRVRVREVRGVVDYLLTVMTDLSEVMNRRALVFALIVLEIDPSPLVDELAFLSDIHDMFDNVGNNLTPADDSLSLETELGFDSLLMNVQFASTSFLQFAFEQFLLFLRSDFRFGFLGHLPSNLPASRDLLDNMTRLVDTFRMFLTFMDDSSLDNLSRLSSLPSSSGLLTFGDLVLSSCMFFVMLHMLFSRSSSVVYDSSPSNDLSSNSFSLPGDLLADLMVGCMCHSRLLMVNCLG